MGHSSCRSTPHRYKTSCWTWPGPLLLGAALLLLHPGGAGGHEVRAACGQEAQVCEFYLEMTEGRTMTVPQKDGSILRLDVDAEGQVYRLHGGTRQPVQDIDLSKVPLGDGSYKKVLLYNGTLPGPPIVVYEGQQVMMRLWNRMSGSGTTVHFHGVKQHNTPWMDGVSGVSHCDILPGERFTYRFLASPVGTHWYHSHHGTQRSMGAAGPFIVLERNQTTIQQRRGNSQLPAFDNDFYMVIQDWFRDKSEDIVFNTSFDMVKFPYNRRTDICYNSTKQYDHVDTGVVPFMSALINGRGRYMGQNPGYPTPTYLPYELYKVKIGQHYRFRVIGASLQFPLELSIDNHPLNVIAADGNHLKTKAMDSIIVHNGERYDFYIKAGNPLNVGNYWIRVQTLERIQDDHLIKPGFVRAILSYDGAPRHDPSTSPKMCTPQEPCHTSNCPYPSEVTAAYNIVCHPLTDFSLTQPEPTLEPEEGETIHEIFLNYHFAVSDVNQPKPITTPDNYTWQPRSGTEKPTINGVQNILPVSSLMTYPDNPEDTIKHCRFTSCSRGLCRECEHHLHLPLNKVIQLNLMVTLNNKPGTINGNDHPIHIHGHSMQVLKVSYPTYHPVTKAYYKGNTDISCPEDNCNSVVWTNRSWAGGNVPGILRQGAPLKDSLVIPVGGYVVTRFRTDNAGYWFMHCHLEFHNSEGMSLVLKAGNESQMNAKPRGMRTCSNFRWPEEGEVKACANHSGVDEDPMQRDIERFQASSIALYVVVILIVPLACSVWRLYCSTLSTSTDTDTDSSSQNTSQDSEHLGLRYHQVTAEQSQKTHLGHLTM